MNSECFLTLNTKEYFERGKTVENLGAILARYMTLEGHTAQTNPRYFHLLYRDTDSEIHS